MNKKRKNRPQSGIFIPLTAAEKKNLTKQAATTGEDITQYVKRVIKEAKFKDTIIRQLKHLNEQMEAFKIRGKN